MNRNTVLAFVALCGSCDAFWGYTKVPLLDGNCQVGGAACKPYEACSEATEQCERQAPRVDSSSVRVIFSDGDETVTLTGAYFAPDTEVLIDNQPVSMLSIKSAQELSFRTPTKLPALSFGSAPATLTLRSGDKVTTRSDLLSWSPNTATFNAYAIPKVLNETPASSPANIQVGDINGDGKKDIVSRSVGSGKFYVALGMGNGQFQSGAITSTNPSVTASHFILMDVNADGRLDLLFGSGSTIYYSLNNGTGTLGAQQTLKTITGTSLFFGNFDLNGDTKDDLTAIDYSSTNFSTLLANATGGLVPAGTPKGGSLPAAGNKLPLFGDIDKDGKMDMVTSPGSALVSVNFGNNDGTFQPTKQVLTNGLSASVVAISDIDNDGYLDIITTFQGNGDVYVYKNTKNRDFTRMDLKGMSTSASIMMVSDINGDGRADIFCFERLKLNPAGFAYMGRGDGTFGRVTQVLGTTLPAIDDDRYADLDNDGRTDLALIKYGDDAVYAVVTTSK